MKVDKLVGLLFPRSGGTLERTAEVQKPVAATPREPADAVSIASNFGSQTSDRASREEKVARLSEQVRSGAYKPDLREVAAKLYSDLL